MRWTDLADIYNLHSIKWPWNELTLQTSMISLSIRYWSMADRSSFLPYFLRNFSFSVAEGELPGVLKMLSSNSESVGEWHRLLTWLLTVLATDASSYITRRRLASVGRSGLGAVRFGEEPSFFSLRPAMSKLGRIPSPSTERFCWDLVLIRFKAILMIHKSDYQIQLNVLQCLKNSNNNFLFCFEETDAYWCIPLLNSLATYSLWDEFSTKFCTNLPSLLKTLH